MLLVNSLHQSLFRVYTNEKGPIARAGVPEVWVIDVHH